ncbi:hypothetical protein [Candidatus Thiodiazotropha sp. CDECU1]|uniref:hypothetical protein n=1 Tax=Candidatus Thiodiazotropha sp. CDECU1 TaxID=3065865 RepID=UPI00292EC3A8|nr:hypothetical protein [Candidatus Thiodiazotropha sp. CDECU1]
MDDPIKNKLNILSVIKHAISIPILRWKTLSMALLPSGIAMLALDLIYEYGFVPHNTVTGIIYFLISGILLVIFAITCHRNILLGTGSTTKYGVLKWNYREWRYAGWAFIAYFYLYVFAVLGMFLAGSLTALVPGCNNSYYFMALLGITVLPGIYVFARLSILFPATAIEHVTTWNWAWDVTEGNGWRLVIIVGFFPAILSLVPMFLSGINIVLDIVLLIASLMLLAIEIIALSVSFDELTKDHEPYITTTG